MNLPNMITLFRVFLIPVFIAVYFNNPDKNLVLSVVIFFIAGFSDFLDGYLARKNKQVTTFGTVMDPLADKLMLLTVLTSYAYTGVVPYSIFILVLIKEVLMIVGGYVVYKWGIINPANKLGKFVTFSFYIGILVLMFNKQLGIYLLFFSALLGFIAGMSYIKTTLDKKKKKTP
ncbi:MAG: CDP-diacylglycerol--glycerol-3-phosphate 3-phosphatidyltransferase [Clostridiaceae bacterium]